MTISLIALTNFLLSTAELQAAIDASDFYATVTLSDDQPDVARDVWHAAFDGKPLVFTLARLDAASLANGREDLTPFACAVGVPGDGELISTITGIAALLAYVGRASGMLVQPGANPAPSLREWRKCVDAVMAAESKRMPDFYRKYPEDVVSEPGPTSVEARLADDWVRRRR